MVACQRHLLKEIAQLHLLLLGTAEETAVSLVGKGCNWNSFPLLLVCRLWWTLLAQRDNMS